VILVLFCLAVVVSMVAAGIAFYYVVARAVVLWLRDRFSREGRGETDGV
jgi:hypothetical protein